MAISIFEIMFPLTIINSTKLKVIMLSFALFLPIDPLPLIIIPIDILHGASSMRNPIEFLPIINILENGNLFLLQWDHRGLCWEILSVINILHFHHTVICRHRRLLCHPSQRHLPGDPGLRDGAGWVFAAQPFPHGLYSNPLYILHRRFSLSLFTCISYLGSVPYHFALNTKLSAFFIVFMLCFCGKMRQTFPLPKATVTHRLKTWHHFSNSLWRFGSKELSRPI